MKNIDKVFWKWDKGTSYIEVTYSNLEVKKIFQPKNPPTKPSHDICHILCAFHGLNWDFTNENTVQLAEFNAVFIEHILMRCCQYNEKNNNLDNICNDINSYLKYFCNEYYKIPDNMGDHYNFNLLKSRFLDKLNVKVLDQHYNAFYKVFYLDTIMNIPNLHFTYQSTFINNIKNYRVVNDRHLKYFTDVKEFLRGIS